MPQTPHTERHFTGTETVRDIVIGMSDGLTVPFALAAGLSLFSGYRRQKDSAQHFDRSRGGFPHTAQTPGEHPLGDTATAGAPAVAPAVR